MLLKYCTRFKELVLFEWHLNYIIWTLPNKNFRFLCYPFRCLLKQCLISHFFQGVYSHVDFIHINQFRSSVNTDFIHSKDGRMSHLSLSGPGSALGVNRKGSSLLHYCTFARGLHWLLQRQVKLKPPLLLLPPYPISLWHQQE